MFQRCFLMLFCSGMVGIAVASSVSPEFRVAHGLLPIVKGQSVTSLQPYRGEFRILSTKRYTQDEQAKFSPVDYAVSWGTLAQSALADQIHARQYDRFLNWQLKTLPVAPQQAMQMVSNIHIIPANPKMAVQIQQVKKGDLVRLMGDLVEVRDQNLVWRSSLTRDDVGEGACELFRVKSIQWLENSKNGHS